MMLSVAGLEFIKNFEKFMPKPYQDGGGVWTIGYGATHDEKHQPVTALTPPITLAQAEALLARDAGDAVMAVSIAVTREITQYLFDACVSLCFNIGTGAFHDSSVLKLINAGQDPSQAWLAWDHIHGKVDAGLLRRRKAEVAVFA